MKNTDLRLRKKLTQATGLVSSILVLGSIVVGTPKSAQAVVLSLDSTEITTQTNANDCSGFFGQGFDNCDIGNNFTDNNGNTIEISPPIAKFDTDGTGWTTALAYPSIDGSEFDTTDFTNANSSGSWSYTPDDTTDPGVRFWVAKGGNQGFRLFWEVEDAETQAGGACATNLFTVDCLSKAKIVNSGNWSTPPNRNGNLPGLSHITFYNSKQPTDIPTPIPTTPEPASGISLLLVGALVSAVRPKK
ncbi:MAG: hypothetical protein D6756_03070 [Cyanobacteria bacterium J083]|nr:MAG: hypothetical protein D6756_03070 [Cyanobacteria bacterium J083]